MIVTPVPVNLNGARLLEELAAAGVKAGVRDVSVSDDHLVFALPDTVKPTVVAVVAAHTGAQAVAATNKATSTARAIDALIGLRALVESTGTLTGGQLSSGIRLVARALVAVIRLQLDRHESAD